VHSFAWWLLAGTVLVALASQGFTGAVEWLGYRLQLGDRVLGSILAAWGTALPETVIPLVAVAGRGTARHEVGVGAILGAPFLLATVAFALLGATIWLRSWRGGPPFLQVSPRQASADLFWFAFLFSLAVAAGLLPSLGAGTWLVPVLLGAYGLYLVGNLRHGHEGAAEPPRGLAFWSVRRPPSYGLLVGVLMGSIGLLVGGAQAFVAAVASLGQDLGISPLLLAVVMAPLATELPEVVNSVVWTWRGRDDLALSAVTGAMIIQSTVGPSLGLVFTPWKLGPQERFAAFLAVAAALFFALGLRFFRRMEAGPLLMGAAFYAVFLLGVAVHPSGA
jgi:cation:H+ antiporter